MVPIFREKPQVSCVVKDCMDGHGCLTRPRPGKTCPVISREIKIFNFVSDQDSEHAPVRKLDRKGDEETGLEVDVWNYSGKIIYVIELA